MQKRYGSESHPFTADMKIPFQKCAHSAVIAEDVTLTKSARATIRNVRLSLQPLAAPLNCTSS
jgi:hypothetical protein